jgi:hypothetical protein
MLITQSAVKAREVWTSYYRCQALKTAQITEMSASLALLASTIQQKYLSKHTVA